MQLALIFKSVQKYLDESWERLRQNNTVANMGQAVVLLVPQITLTAEDSLFALKALKELKSKHPGN